MQPRIRWRSAAELTVLALAMPPLAWAWHADLPWLLRHWSLDTNALWTAYLWRGGAVLAAVLLATIVRPRVGRWVDRLGPAEALAAGGRMAIAFALALGASEVTLRVVGLPKKHDFYGSCDNQTGQPDPRTGWVWRPRYARTVKQGGRPIDFAFDEHGDRARSADYVEDPQRPTIVLVGESIMAGHGLTWNESLAGLLGAEFDAQVVTLGVDGYGSDQAFVRLFDALPRLSRVVAIVTMFFPFLVDRVGWADRPRLRFDGDVPVVAPPGPGFWGDLRVVRELTDLLPYRDEAAIALTGAILRQTARLARERGARALFLAPHLGRSQPRGDRYLLDELLVRQGLEVLEPDWEYETLPGDNHPNPASTRQLAAAIVRAVRRDAVDGAVERTP